MSAVSLDPPVLVRWLTVSSAVADLSYAFIGLPGGYGTLEEVAEMTTWSQIGVHLKRESPFRLRCPAHVLISLVQAVVLLNINGFYSSLREFINKCARLRISRTVRT